MEYKPIRTQAQYDFVAERMEQLTNAEPNSEEAEELKLLTSLIREFESTQDYSHVPGQSRLRSSEEGC